MAYDENLADRIRLVLRDRGVFYLEKKMMGGLAFMVKDKMCVGIIKNNLMARVGPDQYNTALKKSGCREMDFTGKPMKGYVFVEPFAVDLDSELDFWIKLCLDFNAILTGIS